MKRLNIIIAVFFLVSSTVLAVGIPMKVNLDFGQWLVLTCIVLLGCLEAYLYFDNYIDMVKDDNTLQIPFTQIWNNAYDEGYKDGFVNATKEINAS